MIDLEEARRIHESEDTKHFTWATYFNPERVGEMLDELSRYRGHEHDDEFIDGWWTCRSCGRRVKDGRDRLQAKVEAQQRELEAQQRALNDIATASWEPGVYMNHPSAGMRFTSKAGAAEWMRKAALAALDSLPHEAAEIAADSTESPSPGPISWDAWPPEIFEGPEQEDAREHGK